MKSETVFGPLPIGWESLTLGEICKRTGGDIQTGPFGSQLHASDYVSHGIPSIMPQNIGDNRVIEDGIARITVNDAQRLSRYLVQPGDIVYSRRGDVEKRALIRDAENGWLCGTGCLRVRFGGDVDPRYASYYLGHPQIREWIVRHAHGATMPNLNTTILSNVPFVVPPLPEQKAIARVLGSLDDKIELNRRMNATLEQIAQTLFRAWFVDFEPVKAKAAGLQPVGMDAETAGLFPSEFEESALGPIPKGWQAKPLNEAFDINPTRRSPGSTYLDMSNVPTQGHRPVGWVQREPKSGMKFINGDTLLARITPCLENGKTAFVDFLEENEVGWGSTEFIVLHPRAPLPAYFAYLLCRHEGFRSFAIQSMTGTSGRQRVQTSSLSQYLLAVPNKEICERFAKFVQPLVNKIASNSVQSRTLAQIRDALLPRLISGQLRVPETMLSSIRTVDVP